MDNNITISMAQFMQLMAANAKMDAIQSLVNSGIPSYSLESILRHFFPQPTTTSNEG